MRPASIYTYLGKLGLAVSLIVASAVVHHFQDVTTDREALVRDFEKALQQQEARARQTLHDFVADYRGEKESPQTNGGSMGADEGSPWDDEETQEADERAQRDDEGPGQAGQELGHTDPGARQDDEGPGQADQVALQNDQRSQHPDNGAQQVDEETQEADERAQRDDEGPGQADQELGHTDPGAQRDDEGSGQAGQASQQADERSLREEASRIRKLKSLFEDKGLVLAVFKDVQPVFWSHNHIPLQGQPPEVETGVSDLQNGWYYHYKREAGDHTYVVYYLVKQDYKYQNQFLVNRFHEALPQACDKFFVSDRQDEGHGIYSSDGTYLFSLVLRREAALETTCGWRSTLSKLLAIAGTLAFLFFTFRYFSGLFQAGRRLVGLAGFVITVAAVRMFSFLLEIPRVLYDTTLFSPELYATSDMLPSLGDLLVNVGLVAVIGYFLFSNLRRISLQVNMGQATRLISAFGLFLLIYLMCGLSLKLIEGLVINSDLNLNVNFIFKLDAYSMIGFLIIGLIFFAFFFFSIVLCRLAYGILKEKKRFWQACLAYLLILAGLTWVFIGVTPLLWMLTLVAIAVFWLDLQGTTPQKSFSALITALFLFSLISTFAMYRFNEEKDREIRKSLVLHLASEQDPVAEFLFLEMEEALFHDNQLQSLIRHDPYNEALIYNYLQYHYFYDFWEKYDLQVTICRPGEPLLIKPANIEVPCADFFEDYIHSYGKETVSDRFIYLDNDTGRNSYITKITTGEGEPDDHLTYHLYIEFDAKFIARDMGFPELLIDDAIDLNRKLINYSHATYKSRYLVNEFGPFSYNVSAAVYPEPEEEFTYFDFDGHCHLMYQKDEETLILISRSHSTIIEAIAPFSYLFITFFLLVAAFWLLVNQRTPSHLVRMTFRRRVQYSMIAILLVAALSIGGVSAWFIYNIYENKNQSFLNEKAHSILLELEEDLADDRVLHPGMEYFLYDLLLQYANVFFTDINLYNPEGWLVASSRPKVFEEGLVGRTMDPVAHHKMRGEQRSQFAHNERIGKLDYLSAYTPLYNRFNEKLGYLNLPYFAKQSELRNEVSFFLVAFVNIYLLLVVLTVVVALFVSSYVTKPLQLIRDNMAKVQLGRKNSKIDWRREDEIGSLVREYNRMIDELAVSARLLAQSERESAWREMARQVAHEIKNPLTPMRLNVQYLEKAWKEKAPDWDKRLERFTKTMIEQIDNLSVIAGEFSHFAQMPAGKKESLDLRQLLPEVLDLYKDMEKVDIRLQLPEDREPMVVFADRNQLLRVFNNLIRNAIQSYPKGEKAEIEVTCRAEEGQYRVEVSDQGCGIPEDLKHNIFSPYFTTKTKGMGLGLSMVKHIIEGFGGQVFFSSREGEGSTFGFHLPAAATDPGTHTDDSR